MNLVNINHGLKTDRTVGIESYMWNGCSGNAMILTDPVANGGFGRKLQRNFWDLLLSGFSGYGDDKPGHNRRLRIIFLKPGVRVPAPSRWFKPPKDYAAYYLMSGRKKLAVLGTYKPEHFDSPTSPPALFLADPEKYASLRHLEEAGVFSRQLAVPKPRNSRPSIPDKPTVTVYSSQIRISGNNYSTPVGPGNLARQWSSEFTMLSGMPWWEVFRLNNMAYPSSEEMVQYIADSLPSLIRDTRLPHDLVHVSGNANLYGPLDSIRAAFCFHALNPEATFDLEATPAVTTSSGHATFYYKLLPFYYHSPQHMDHRVVTCLLSRNPIHLKRIV